jgi:hypothetical protein
MKKNIIYRKTPSQKLFHEDNTTPILFFAGGLGSGKTYGLAQKLLKLSFLNMNCAGGLLCPSYSDYKKDILPIFEEIDFKNKIGISVNKTDKTFYFPWSKAPLYVFTGEKPIAGPNLGYCGINEYSLMPYERINEMMRRVRVKHAQFPQRCFAGTPEDVHGWLDEFIEKQSTLNRIKVIKAKTTENKHVDPEYIEHLKATLDPQAFKLFAEGEFIKLNGALYYYNYSSKNNSDCVYRSDQVIHIGLDFNVGNMTAIFCHVVGNGEAKEIQVFDELILKNNGANTYDMCTAILNRYPKHMVKITCDASGNNRKTTGPTDVQVLKSIFGTEAVRFKSTNPRHRKRQILVNGAFHNQKIWINPKNCPILKRDLLRVDQDARNFEKIKTNPELTHSSDCLDYIADFEFTIREKESFNKFKLF